MQCVERLQQYPIGTVVKPTDYWALLEAAPAGGTRMQAHLLGRDMAAAWVPESTSMLPERTRHCMIGLSTEEDALPQSSRVRPARDSGHGFAISLTGLATAGAALCP